MGQLQTATQIAVRTCESLPMAIPVDRMPENDTSQIESLLAQQVYEWNLGTGESIFVPITLVTREIQAGHAKAYKLYPSDVANSEEAWTEQYADLDRVYAMTHCKPKPIFGIQYGQYARIVDGWHTLYAAWRMGNIPLPLMMIEDPEAVSRCSIKVRTDSGENPWGKVLEFCGIDVDKAISEFRGLIGLGG